MNQAIIKMSWQEKVCRGRSVHTTQGTTHSRYAVARILKSTGHGHTAEEEDARLYKASLVPEAFPFFIFTILRIKKGIV